MRVWTSLRVFLLWRLALFVVVGVAATYIPFRSFMMYAGAENMAPRQGVASVLVYPWANFDGIHYLHIAGRGYVDEARFLPAFPILLRALYWGAPLSLGQVLMGLLVTHVSFGAALVVLYHLLRLDYSHRQTEQQLLLLLLFPSSFFFVSVYTESLFLLLLVVSLYAARRGQWLVAVTAGMLLSITRLTGILIVLPLMVEYYQSLGRSQRNWRGLLSGWWLALPVLPLLAYAAYNALKWGDPLLFVHGHGALANGRAVDTIVLPVQTLYRYLKIFLSVTPLVYEFWLSLVEVFATFVSGWLLWKAHEQHVRPSYTVMAVSMWLVPVLSGTFSGMPRYIVLLVPMYLALSQLIPDRFRTFTYGLLFILQLAAVGLFARGYLVG